MVYFNTYIPYPKVWLLYPLSCEFLAKYFANMMQIMRIVGAASICLISKNLISHWLFLRSSRFWMVMVYMWVDLSLLIYFQSYASALFPLNISKGGHLLNHARDFRQIWNIFILVLFQHILTIWCLMLERLSLICSFVLLEIEHKIGKWSVVTIVQYMSLTNFRLKFGNKISEIKIRSIAE